MFYVCLQEAIAEAKLLSNSQMSSPSSARIPMLPMSPTLPSLPTAHLHTVLQPVNEEDKETTSSA